MLDDQGKLTCDMRIEKSRYGPGSIDVQHTDSFRLDAVQDRGDAEMRGPSPTITYGSEPASKRIWDDSRPRSNVVEGTKLRQVREEVSKNVGAVEALHKDFAERLERLEQKVTAPAPQPKVGVRRKGQIRLMCDGQLIGPSIVGDASRDFTLEV